MSGTIWKSMPVLGLLSIATIGCEPGAATDDTAGATSAAADNEAVARAYMQAYNDRDLDAMRDVLAEEIVVGSDTFPRDDFVSMIETYYWTTFPDMRFGDATVVGAEQHATVHVDVLATGSGDYLGTDVTGATATAGEMMLFHIEDGRIHEYEYEWNELSFLVQMGVIADPYATR